MHDEGAERLADLEYVASCTTGARRGSDGVTTFWGKLPHPQGISVKIPEKSQERGHAAFTR